MSVLLTGGIIGGIIGGLGAAYYSIIKKPHGFVEFKTGLVLKFTPEFKAGSNLINLRNAYDDISIKEVRKRKLTANNEQISIPTRHGDVKSEAFKVADAENRPLIVFIHGGGWCIGSIDSHREQCIRVSQSSGLSVLSLEYSLAPEYPYPHALEECQDAVEWILNNKEFQFCDSSRIILMGDSAGGNLSIAVTYDRLKKDGAKGIVEVVPIYPATDCHSEKGGSFTDFEKGYYLTKILMDTFNEGYFKNGGDTTSPMVSPLLHDDFEGFPDTYLITAGYDPLRDEGEAFAEKLKNKGANVFVKRYEGAVHGFFALALFGKKGLTAAKEMGEYLRKKYN
ncbi:MAG: alpha/beta hydrolase [Saprospiraceae bacterium]|nr:alpha/beta hydrolase [Saprospiraceae bacterium]